MKTPPSEPDGVIEGKITVKAAIKQNIVPFSSNSNDWTDKVWYGAKSRNGAKLLLLWLARTCDVNGVWIGGFEDMMLSQYQDLDNEKGEYGAIRRRLASLAWNGDVDITERFTCDGGFRRRRIEFTVRITL